MFWVVVNISKSRIMNTLYHFMISDLCTLSQIHYQKLRKRLWYWTKGSLPCFFLWVKELRCHHHLFSQAGSFCGGLYYWLSPFRWSWDNSRENVWKIWAFPNVVVVQLVLMALLAMPCLAEANAPNSKWHPDTKWIWLIDFQIFCMMIDSCGLWKPLRRWDDYF